MAKRLCLIVGCGQGGIGDACIRKYASEGYQVAFLARSKDNLDAIETGYGIPASVKGFQCDVTKKSDILSTYSAITNHFHTSHVHTLIFNTTMPLFKSFDDISDEEFNESLLTGPMSLFRFTKLVLPKMQEMGVGVIGITGASASFRGLPSTMGIASAKSAIRAMAQSLCRDNGRKGIHVFHAIIDGVVDQPRTHAWLPNKPAEEFINPDAIANTYFHISQQPPSCWTFEFSVGPGSVSTDMVTN